MLFNSPEFILLFLPVTLAGFYLLGMGGHRRAAILWLVTASLFFYGWWDARFVLLMVSSVVFNYTVGSALARQPRRWLLVVGVAGNLLALGWFKYSGFLVEVVNAVSGFGIPLPDVILPLALSFYTFQQVAFLVDSHDGTARANDFLKYSLFVVFFPQLIAGPIVHHKEMMPQYERPEIFRLDFTNLGLGLAAFTIGLFKKVCIADSLAPTVDALFETAALGAIPSFFYAWIGATSFTIQLYFDFSGYSDMAIGLALMFGLRLPFNFASPFKAPSIIDFWSRWHMTLTRFFTAYVYNPIAMALTKRRLQAGKPVLRRSSPALGPFIILLAVPTLITMGLAGVWHGAGWQFVVFGLLHGTMLVGNHGWRAVRHAVGAGPSLGRPFRPLGVLLTFAAVTVSLVFFRADSLELALLVVKGMSGLYQASDVAMDIRRDTLPILVAGLAIIWLLPSTQQWLGLDGTDKASPGQRFFERLRWIPAPWQWQPSAMVGVMVGGLLCMSLLRAFGAVPAQFLYYTF